MVATAKITWAEDYRITSATVVGWLTLTLRLQVSGSSKAFPWSSRTTLYVATPISTT